MSDIIEPQDRVFVRRQGLIVDDSLDPVPAEGSALRANAYPASDVEPGDFTDGPVLVRSSGFELQHRGITIGALTMVTISFLTFWVPGLGAILAGMAGGFFAKRWGRAFLSAAIASVAVPAALVFLDTMKATGDLRFLWGLGFANWTLLHIVSLFIGAALGVYSCPLVDRSGGLRRELPE
jgi:hypothetical protein